jgi:hypothetical protein
MPPMRYAEILIPIVFVLLPVAIIGSCVAKGMGWTP